MSLTVKQGLERISKVVAFEADSVRPLEEHHLGVAAAEFHKLPVGRHLDATVGDPNRADVGSILRVAHRSQLPGDTLVGREEYQGEAGQAAQLRVEGFPG